MMEQKVQEIEYYRDSPFIKPLWVYTPPYLLQREYKLLEKVQYFDVSYVK